MAQTATTAPARRTSGTGGPCPAGLPCLSARAVGPARAASRVDLAARQQGQQDGAEHQGVRPDFCRQGQSGPRGTTMVPAGVGTGEPTAAHSAGPGRIQSHPGPRTGGLRLPGTERCRLHLSGAAPALFGGRRAQHRDRDIPDYAPEYPRIRAGPPPAATFLVSRSADGHLAEKSTSLGAVPVSLSLRDYERPFPRPRQSVRSPRFTSGVPGRYRAPETDIRESPFTCESHRVGGRGPDGRVAGLGSGATEEPRSGEHRSRRYRWRGHRGRGP